ncbi:CHAT domain-containing protein [candidate division KSB1 bacterium]|nr:CHAT domain-containing protein [candidate division KSB1 bacterium]
MQRAFLIAGTNSVIANLWKIDDKAAKDLTVSFFQNWLNFGHDKAEALRQAQLNMINLLKNNPIYDFPHPYFWAAASFTGLYY